MYSFNAVLAMTKLHMSQESSMAAYKSVSSVRLYQKRYSDQSNGGEIASLSYTTQQNAQKKEMRMEVES